LLYVAAITILVSFPVIAGDIYEAVGGDGAIGPEYPLALATRLIPGAAGYLVLATIATYWTARRAPGRLRAAFFLCWLGLALVTLGAIAWYFSPQGPRAP
jgi:hypothetical protein